ncbi:winged helix-turn-helix transcriptional regulator, partial [Ruminococcaceae bacterium OttesenSCG-928-O06]|nr:winged helix-turn-helix transcriptional regulator [Ruminococcaceae bacterium OttesenSCG-928-O06]
MATEREQEILRLIQDDPMISQQELARRVGITRSSVSVHITNLVKKGLLRGRGYLLPPGGEGYVAVVGGANMDIGGRPLAPLVPRDSNPGTVGFSPGGVGRNIAHNLALMGQGVRFISAFGADDAGHQLADSCRKAGVDITHAPRMEDEASATYLFITNKAGDMELAVADMAIYERITPAFLAQRLEILNRAEYCVFDTNPPQETLAFLCEQVSCPLVVDPVSTSKAKKLFGLLPRLHTLKCNRMEAALLADVPIENDDDLPRAGAALLCAGVQNVVIT